MRLNPFVLSALLLAAPMSDGLSAQQRLTADAEVRAAPTGNVVATLRNGTAWTTGSARGGWTELTISGWVETSRFAGPRESFPQSINEDTDGWRIREEPSLNGRILGEFKGGAGLHVAERRGNWARIRREVWVQSSLLARVQASANAATAPAASTAPPRGTPTPATSTRGTTPATSAPTAASQDPAASSGGGAGPLRVTATTPLLAGPGGETLGSVNSGAVATPLARERGWVKVQVEAWVLDSMLLPTDSGFVGSLSAADLRLKPDEYRGRVVRWEVQVVGLQYADPLRRDLADGEPFLLAVGPRGEEAILYFAIPPSLIEQAKAIPPMSTVSLTARVRNGRSRPTGTPVLDLLSISRD
ncbi:MAG: SH3 domain-containing protein [Gemmatimonadaceae bacterium]|nr:SH3 domain-containing protein [Gemmatimonadaceae bacterium]